MKSEKILSTLLPEVFEYKEKYKDFYSKCKCDILKYPFNIRNLIYQCYPRVRDSSKEFRISNAELNRIMDSDNELKYLDIDLTQTELSNNTFNHLLKEDYEYLTMNSNERKYYEMNNIVKYKKSVFSSISNHSKDTSTNELSNDTKDDYIYNIEFYYQNDIFPIKNNYNISILSNIASYDLLKTVKKINYEILLKRFVFSSHQKTIEDIIKDFDKDIIVRAYFNVLNEYKYKDDYKDIVYDEYIAHVETNRLLNYTISNVYNAMLLLKYSNKDNILLLISSFEKLKLDVSIIANKLISFEDLTNDTVKRFIDKTSIVSKNIVEILKDYDIMSYQNVFYKFNYIPNSYNILTVDYSIVNLFNRLSIDNKIDNINTLINNLQKHYNEVTNDRVLRFMLEILNIKIDIKDYLKLFDIDYRTEFINGKPLGYYYISNLRFELPFELYTNPMLFNLATVWKSNHPNIETPKEMTDEKYYDYMVRNNGNKRPKNNTVMYTYFSNTEVNYIMFVSSDYILDEPVKMRYIIPIEFELVKEFLTFDMNPTGICSYISLKDKDLNKIIAGYEGIDIIAFSSMFEYLKYTTMSKLVEFFKESLEVKFEITISNELNL